MLTLALALLVQQPVPADTVIVPTDSATVEVPTSGDPFAEQPPAELEPTLPADTTRRPGVTLRWRFSPTALYTSSRGFGVAGGIDVKGLLREGTRTRLDARLSQRLQTARLRFYTADPWAARPFVLIGLSGRTTTSDALYGIGPRSERATRLKLSETSASADVRGGWYPFGTQALLVAPGAQFYFNRLRDVEDGRDSAQANVGAATLDHLAALEDVSRYGMAVGLDVATDSRDRAGNTTRGVLAATEYQRFFALDGSGLAFSRYGGRVFGFLPLGGGVVAIGRAVGLFTRGGYDADDDQEPGLANTGGVPYYYLPVLDDDLLAGYPRNRFVARDVIAFGAGVRLPVVRLMRGYGVEALVMGYAGGAYTGVRDEFTFRLSFSSDPPSAGERLPLRPSVGLGLGLVDMARERIVIGALFGYGPEGAVTGSVRVVYDLRDFQPLFR